MTPKTLLSAGALLLMMGAIPSTAYHIDGAFKGTADATTLTAADWTTATPLLTICESEYGAGTGPGGTAADDRNANGVGNPGNGGLCTSGRNDATGEAVPAKPTATGSAAGAVWTRFDICSITTVQRNAVLVAGQNSYSAGPYSPAASCAGNPGTGFSGNTNTIGFTGRVGTYQCAVAATDALYYDEYYAYMTYDGTPGYTGGDAAGTAHGGTLYGGLPSASGGLSTKNVDAFHGHVTAFVDVSTSVGTPPVSGSAVTTNVPQLSGAPDFSAITISTTTSNCGGSPACAPGTIAATCATPYGPVFMAPGP